MTRGLLLIFLFYWLGEAISLLIDGFVPGSVLGMLALFSCLLLKWVKPDQVRDTARAITGHMAIFLIPSAVGIMMYTQPLLQAILPIGVAIGISTPLTMLVVALIQQTLETRANRKSAVS